MREQLKGPTWQPAVLTPEEKIENSLAVGTKVRLVGMNLEGTVVSAPDSNDQLEIQVGNTTVRMAPENLEKSGNRRETTGRSPDDKKFLATPGSQTRAGLAGKKGRRGRG